MNKKIKKSLIALIIASFFVVPMAGVEGGAQGQGFQLPSIKPYLSADGMTLYNGVAPLIVVADPNPVMQGIKIPQSPELQKALVDPAAAGSTFSITFVPAGGTDYWSQGCTTFPEAAKTAFNAAASIWANTLQSSVPITIRACWASLSSTSILGYSGAQPLRRDFSGAPQAGTWYDGSLANSLNGSDLDPTSFDMNITYNSNFAWYYGTDSNPPGGQYDLVTVAAHEIGHGLNFSGSAQYSGGTGQVGYSGFPLIYDRFMEDSGGTKLINYANPSSALGSLLTSGNLWFNGPNANAANGGSRLKMYAPGTWAGGSSYAHLDYSTFAGTINSMMVYAVSDGSSNHNPGPVTKGLLKDLGWVMAGETPTHFIYLPAVLRNYSGTTTTTASAGFWQSADGEEFYVTPDQANVANFAVYINVTGCDSYKITHTSPVAIVGNQFAFTGTFSASGTFDSATSAHGIEQISSLYIDGCGTVSGGPWNWTATWQDASQPSIIKNPGNPPSVELIPELDLPSKYHTIKIDK